ncbi:MAG: hypothetical protein FWF81_15130 [Defluviitaleaceae bacterium]|nr:hypothetical protein [Defluviitaleaceae bacterium]
MKKYFLGVDGGNTKTDYLLCTLDGEFVDLHRTGQCSHENFSDGYDGMERVMRTQLSELFDRNSITVSDIAAAGFGLAGADLPSQIEKLKERVESIGFTKYGLSNDGILGIKAASESGVGLCAVNGTGTVVIGIDKTNKIIQIGGVGPLSSDFAGGGFIRDKVITFMYDFYYRCGENSTMFPKVMELLSIQPEDILGILGNYELLHANMTKINIIAGDAAAKGDKVAQAIFDDIGETIGKSAAGCIRHLTFDDSSPIDIVLIGSIWHKVPYPKMNETFLETAQKLSGKTFRLLKPDAPAAAGGVLWAKEIFDNAPVDSDYRNKILKISI